MAKENLLSVLDIAQQLDTGKATTKFLLKRFKDWIPVTFIEGQPFYPNDAINTLFTIQGKLEMGILPGDIEKELDGKRLFNGDAKKPNQGSNLFDTLSNNKNIQEDIRLSKEGLQILRSVFTEIGEQQNRIAKAHEKRAEVEERKAIAIEKRAEAEEKKADAMNNIAKALHEMNRLRAPDLVSQQIAHQAASIIVADESDSLSSPYNIHTDNTYTEDILIDDLSLLVEPQTKDPIIETLPETDDLSLLLDETVFYDSEIDDLSQLLDIAPTNDYPPDDLIDDLAKLIDKPVELDDLSALIDPKPELTDVSLDMDNLSLLIDSTTEPSTEPSTEEPTTDSDPITIDISPQEDQGKYKAAVMQVIIGLKTDGLSIEETTKTLNANKVKTLSGKPEWGQKAISQIYKFIDAAK
ncbi:MAG: hypothetical protein ABIJ59_18680 [Pseudomonadota bacterium]